VLLVKAVVECVDDELELGVPAPVQRRAADFGVRSDVKDRHVGIAVQDWASPGGEDDRLVERGIARPPDRPRTVCGVVIGGT
jgi:hypothetical protein